MAAAPSPGADPALGDRLRAALIAAHGSPEISATLDALLLARFDPVSPAAFDVLLERRRAAEQAGYPSLA